MKSGYWIKRNRNLFEHNEVWNIIWATHTMPKVRNFLWRACSNIIPTKMNLVQRHISSDDKCPSCLNEAETLHHTLFHCRNVRDLWIPFLEQDHYPISDMNFQEIIKEWYSKLSITAFHYAITMCWLLWFRRNQIAFNNQCFASVYWLKKCKDTVDSFFFLDRYKCQ